MQTMNPCLICWAAILALIGPNTLSVSAQYRHEGCYRDKTSARALPTETATYIWPGKKHSIKLCNIAAYRKGYTIIGVQAGGECWSMKNVTRANANQTYNRYGTETKCKEGAGDSYANDVYEVKGPHNYTHIGCFKDQSTRALEEKLGDFRFTLRTEDKIDLCYYDAASRGYPVFAIRNEGKCFIGPDKSAAFKYGSGTGCKKGLGCPFICFSTVIDVYTIRQPQHNSLGCFAENNANRAMPTALGNYQFTRNGDAAQLCALDAKTNGYKKFALFDKGKCYSGNDSMNYNKHGSSSACLNGQGSPSAISVYDLKAAAVCPAEWMESDGKCFKAVEAKHSRSNAEEDCRNRGGVLADIPSLAEQDFFERFLRYGKNEKLTATRFWIGATKQNGKFKWESGIEVTFNSWSGSTNPNAAGLDCASIERSSGKWFAESCATELDGFLCSKKAGGAALKPSKILGIGLALVLALYHVLFRSSGW